MGFNKNYLICLIIGGIVSLCAQCNKRFDCANTVYSFEMGIKAYPDKDSIHVGDTIWMEINEPTVLKDAISGDSIDYGGAANLGSAIAFQAFSSMDGQFSISAARKFDLVLLDGIETTNINPTLVHEFLFEDFNGRYVFKLGIIPKETGIFRFIFSNASNVYRRNDRCTKAGFSLNFKNTNQHYYLNPNFTGGPVSPGGDYYFKVY